LEPVSLQEIKEARSRIADAAIKTPLVRLNIQETSAEIYLKLENLQPVGSFKIRGAFNAMMLADRSRLKNGVITASAGNMAQGVAWAACRLGIPCTVVMPDHAPQAKRLAVERMEGRIILVPFDRWWQVLTTRHFEGFEEWVFIHPVSDRSVIAGNGTIGLEIMEDFPDVDTILVPYGGGGLSCGIACAVHSLNSRIKVFACEIETAAPLAASLKTDSPQQIPYIPSFVDGIGGKSVLAEMWPLVKSELSGSIVVSLKETADALRLLAERNHVIAEGAGAVPVAAALSGRCDGQKIVCIVSGANIDTKKLIEVLNGRIPAA
jgi:threonine dehydratase